MDGEVGYGEGIIELSFGSKADATEKTTKTN